MNVRRTFEKMSGVIAAYPFGDTKIVTVHGKKGFTLTEEDINKALEKRRDIKLVSVKKVSDLGDQEAEN